MVQIPLRAEFEFRCCKMTTEQRMTHDEAEIAIDK